MNIAPNLTAKLATRIDAATTASGEPRFVPYWRNALQLWSVRWNLAAVAAVILNALISGAAAAGFIAVFSPVITTLLVILAITCSIIGTLLHQPAVASDSRTALAAKAAQEPPP